MRRTRLVLARWMIGLSVCASLLATLLAGCALPATPADWPTASVTVGATMMPSATPSPAQTPTPSLTPTTTTGLCAATPTPWPPARERPLRFVYLKDAQVWLWQEETGRATQVPLQGKPDGIAVSDDGRLIAYRVRLNDQESEFWVAGSDGEGERRLAHTSSDEVPQRYPGEQYYALHFGWVPGTHLVYYRYERTCCGEGYEPWEATPYIDADSGIVRFTIPGSEVDTVSYVPGGRQLAALAAGELRLIDTADGHILYRFPVHSHGGRGLSMAYSPDGRWLAAATEGAFTVVDTVSGKRRDIPFAYQPIGMGGWWFYPSIEWLGDGPVFYTVFGNDDNNQGFYDERTQGTVWRIDASQGTVTSVYTYTGSMWVAQLSPDRRWLIYRRPMPKERVHEDLCLVDLASGKEVVYDSDPGISIYGWYPDSVHFAYGNRSVRLGHVCGGPGYNITDSFWDIDRLDAERCIVISEHGDMITYKLHWLSGKEVAIVELPAPKQETEPLYDSGGPVYGYFLGE